MSEYTIGQLIEEVLIPPDPTVAFRIMTHYCDDEGSEYYFRVRTWRIVGENFEVEWVSTEAVEPDDLRVVAFLARKYRLPEHLRGWKRESVRA